MNFSREQYSTTSRILLFILLLCFIPLGQAFVSLSRPTNNKVERQHDYFVRKFVTPSSILKRRTRRYFARTNTNTNINAEQQQGDGSTGQPSRRSAPKRSSKQLSRKKYLTTASKTTANRGKYRISSSSSSSKKKKNQQKDPLGIETWRVFGVEVHPDDYCIAEYNYGTNTVSTLQTKEPENNNEEDGDNNMTHATPADKLFLTKPVILALMKRLGIKQNQPHDENWGPNHLPLQFADIRVVRRSLDARRRRPTLEALQQHEKLKGGPCYVFVLDVDVKASYADQLKLKPQSGRLEQIQVQVQGQGTEEFECDAMVPPNKKSTAQLKPKKRVVIVGAGPAGLFCALTLARSGVVTPIVLERGLPVESRGKSIGALINRRSMDPESNFAFGEGGAGTWSDGKLTTRIGRNSDAVRFVLETLVEYGAPETILVHGSPHLGTDNLVRLLRAMRLDLRRLGGEIVFGAKVMDFIIENGVTKGVQVTKGPAIERNVERDDTACSLSDFEGEAKILGDAVVLATGHSARDVYEKLHENGVKLEAKGFAVGFRVEHPQKLINKIQYGNEWGKSVVTGRQSTDTSNSEYFESNDKSAEDCKHKGRLPVASYRLATDRAFDGRQMRGVYSFCMCPGGQIVPASTDPNEVCVNGMSFSRRDSEFSNSALVVTVSPDDDIIQDYRKKHGVLAGVAFQRDMERRASKMGGGGLTVPVQRLPDFIAGKASTTAPKSSYRLGTKPSACHEIYPEQLNRALRDAVTNHFEKQMPGFLSEDALLHGVETRTSSPVRVSRHNETLEALGISNLFPAGEGAGFAGGIVSAAVDGLVVASAVLNKCAGIERKEASAKLKGVGFNY